VDAQLTILQVGSTLRRVCPDVRPGARLDTVFRSVRPEGSITFDWLLQNRSQFFLLKHLAGDLELRGEFVVLPEQSALLFLASPWLTDASEISARGLGFEDFAIHDPVVDLLQLFQASKMALADARKLAAKLTAQRAELRVANERLRQQESEARKLALIAARTDNAVVLSDAVGRVIWVNEGFTRLTGYTLDEVLGRTAGSVLQGPGTDGDTVRRIREHLRKGEGFNAEILNYRKDGRDY
jgi:PAS domain S-box-containing protein